MNLTEINKVPSTILERLHADFLMLRKARATQDATFLSVVIGEIESNKLKMTKFNDSNSISILKKMKKTCEVMKKHGDTSADRELELLEEYLPTSITYDRVKCIIIASEHYQEIIDTDKPMKLMGSILGLFEDVDAEGKDIARAIKEIKADQDE